MKRSKSTERSTRNGVLILGLLTAMGAVAHAADVLPQRLAIEGAAPYVYKAIGGAELRLHVFSPSSQAASTRLPALVFFFGGGWTNGTVEQFVPQAKHLAQRGMVAIVADYRVRARHQTSPFEAMADAKSAIRWVRLHARDLGVDPNRIAAGGGSSGGHIAVSAAVFDTFDEPTEDLKVSSKPNALVLFNPAVNTKFGDRGQEGSPMQHVHSGLPPMLIQHGRADKMVPYSDVERFCGAVGPECHLVGYEGAPHGFFNPPFEDGKWYRETLSEADQFLVKLGYLAPTK
jgi:acetyl esterase